MGDETLDLPMIAAAHLRQCGPHDFGLFEYGCNCPTGDPRPVMEQLINAVARLRGDLEQAQREVFILTNSEDLRLSMAEAERDAMKPVVDTGLAWDDACSAEDADLFGATEAHQQALATYRSGRAEVTPDPGAGPKLTSEGEVRGD